MANPVLGKSLCSDWFFLGQDFEFYYPEDLETFDVETEAGITESQDAI